jgi:hypothetical protein
MSGRTDDEARVLVGRVEGLLGALEQLPEPARATAAEAVEALVDLYGTVLERVVVAVTHVPPSDLLASLVRDEVIGHVLMAHELVPAPPELLHPAPAPAHAAGDLDRGVPVAFRGRRPSAVTAS